MKVDNHLVENRIQNKRIQLFKRRIRLNRIDSDKSGKTQFSTKWIK